MSTSAPNPNPMVTTQEELTAVLTAIRAATHRRAWGEWAAARYAAKRGVPLNLYLSIRKLTQGAARNHP